MFCFLEELTSFYLEHRTQNKMINYGNDSNGVNKSFVNKNLCKTFAYKLAIIWNLELLKVAQNFCTVLYIYIYIYIYIYNTIIGWNWMLEFYLIFAFLYMRTKIWFWFSVVGFYGISAVVGYLMPYPILNIYDFVWLGFMAYQPL